MKIITRRRLILLLFLPLISLPFVFPFREKAQLERDIVEYAKKIQTIAPSIEAPPRHASPAPTIQAEPIQHKPSSPVFNEANRLAYPPQPLGPPYPTTWEHLIEWVGQPDGYANSSLQIINALDGGDIAAERLAADVREWIEKTEYGWGIGSSRYARDPREFYTLDPRILKRLIEPFSTLHDERLQGLQDLDHAHFQPPPLNEFVEWDQWQLRHARQQLPAIDAYLYLDAIHHANNGDVDRALHNVLTLIRLSEHLSANWRLYVYLTSLDFVRYAVLTTEYLINNSSLTVEQYERVADWITQMETWFDYGNVMAATQIIAQQTNVLTDEPMGRGDNRVELTNESSAIDDLTYFFQSMQLDTSRSEANMNWNRKKFLVSGERYHFQSLIMSWCMSGLESRKGRTFHEAIDYLPLKSGLEFEPEKWHLVKNQYKERAADVHRCVWDIVTMKFNTITNLRLIRAACLAELYNLKTGRYPESLEEAASELNTHAPLSATDGKRLRIKLYKKSYTITTESANLLPYLDPEEHSLRQQNRDYSKFRFNRVFLSDVEKQSR